MKINKLSFLFIFVFAISCVTTIKTVKDVRTVEGKYVKTKKKYYENLLIKAAKKHEKEEVKKASIYALSDIKTEDSYRTLMDIYLHDKAPFWIDALKSLSKNREWVEKAKKEILELVKKGDFGGLKFIEAVKLLKIEEAAYILKAYIEQGKYVGECISALGYIRSGEDILISLLKNPELEEEYKIKVITALGKLKSKKAVDYLIEIVKSF